MELKAIAHLGRFKDIILTLFKYGFDDIVGRLDLPGKLVLGKIHPVDPQLSTWRRVRLALEELGPTFIKLGQIISLRPDIAPVELIKELQRLQDDVSPEPYPNIKKTVEDNLQQPMSEVFRHFEREPVAAASLAHVHRAILKENDEVVAVKVQRSDIRQTIATDLYILEAIAAKLHDRLEDLQIYGLPELVEEFKRTLIKELDFSHEARNMKIARRNFSDNPEIRIPKLYEGYCTKQMITMELLQGVKLRDLPAGAQVDRERLAKLGLRAIVKQVLQDGFFHADPHPGNLLIQDNSVLCLLDWGMAGRLIDSTRYEVIDIINAVAEKDSEKLLNILLNFVSWDSSINQRMLQRDLLEILDVYHKLPIREVNVSQLLWEIATLLRVYRLRVPIDMAIMIKALVTAEGTARQLYPDLNVVAETEPYVKRMLLERLQPQSVWKSIRRNLSLLLSLQKELPGRLGRIVEKIERGELSIRFQHRDLDGIRNTLENVTNRLTSGVIIAAMIIGSSMIITTGVKPLLFGYPVFGIIGFIISGLLGLYLIYEMIRSRKF